MCPEPQVVAGWDIGGANVKAARLALDGGRLSEARTIVRAFEIWREPGRLAEVLRTVAGDLDLAEGTPTAVTMTAELSDVFRTRREGVERVLDAVAEALGRRGLVVLNVAGGLVPPEEGRRRPLDLAATNWVASASYAATRVADCVLVDVGSTTTDIIAVRDGRIAAEGRDDAGRLCRGELVYSGALRTNPNTFVRAVPLRGRMCPLAAEWFAQTADVYVVLGRLDSNDYTCATPDGRGTDPESARARLARVVCEDAEVQSEEETLAIARHIAEVHLRGLGDALLQVLTRQPKGAVLPLLPAGVGAFLVRDMARRLRLELIEPDVAWGAVDAVGLPAGAVAALLARELGLLR